MRARALRTVSHQSTVYEIGENRPSEIRPGMALQVVTFTVGGEAGLTRPADFTDNVRHGDFAAVANFVRSAHDVRDTGSRHHGFSQESEIGVLAFRAIRESHVIRPRLLGLELDLLQTGRANSRTGRVFASNGVKELVTAALFDTCFRHFDPTMSLSVNPDAGQETQSTVADARIVRRPKDSTEEIEQSLHAYRAVTATGGLEVTEILNHKVTLGDATVWAHLTLGQYGATVAGIKPTGETHRQLWQHAARAKKILGR